MKIILLTIEMVLSPITYIASLYMWIIRRIGVRKLPLSLKIFRAVGVFPIRDHYYEPSFNYSNSKEISFEERFLPAINLNIKEQINILRKFNYESELKQFPLTKPNDLSYGYNVGFGPGDAEYLYSIIRLYKPKKIIEIGSGNSTLIALEAIKANLVDNQEYKCSVKCIEPYEKRWLEKTDAQVIRKKVEDIDLKIFDSLDKGDILFIDSSHIIRPQGDVLREILQILPILKTGVLIHIHDIFTPRDYKPDWIVKDVRFWNEQYILEAFLSDNLKYRIIGSLNYLKHNYKSELFSKLPIIKSQPLHEPGSFWIIKN